MVNIGSGSGPGEGSGWVRAGGVHIAPPESVDPGDRAATSTPLKRLFMPQSLLTAAHSADCALQCALACQSRLLLKFPQITLIR